jgi:hypothetical protein
VLAARRCGLFKEAGGTSSSPASTNHRCQSLHRSQPRPGMTAFPIAQGEAAPPKEGNFWILGARRSWHALRRAFEAIGRALARSMRRRVRSWVWSAADHCSTRI